MSEPSASSQNPTTVLPNRRVFIWRPIIRIGLVVGLVALAGYFFLPLFAPADPGLTVWLGAGAAIVAVYGVNRWVTFRRTSYEFYDDRLVVKTGSIVTRRTIDLPYRNVTQVVLRLPFVEHHFFGTGHLSVHAAGSIQGTAHLESIDDPHRLYDRVADHLRANGFSLGRDRQLQQEAPHLIGTVLDTSGMAIGGLIALLTIGLTIAGTIIDLMNLQGYYELFDVLMGAVEAEDPQDAAIAFRGTLGLAILAVVGATAGLVKVAIHFVDLNRRTYTLYDDVVDYRDGFLTETYKFVPVENLADTATDVPFLKRLFGMADVKLSPHGSASGIRFPSMPRADRFRGHLDDLIESTDGPGRTAADDGGADGQPGGEAAEPIEGRRVRSATESRLPDIDAPPLDFGPSYLRRTVTALVDTGKFVVMLAVLVAIVFVAVTYGPVDLEQLELPIEEFTAAAIVPGAVVLTVLYGGLQLTKALFYCATTDYRVGRRKMTWERDFISRDEFEFTNDKITTLVVQRDLIDRLVGTATITFWSIGNNTPLVFEDIADATGRTDEIRRRLGLKTPEENAQRRDRPSANLLDAIAGRLYSWLFWLTAALGAAVGSAFWSPAVYGAALLVAIPVFRLVKDLIYYRFCRVTWFDDHIKMRRGIILITEHYVPYDQIRSVSTVRYPGRTRGTLRLVPGSAGRVSMRYLDEPRQLHERLDDRLYPRPMRPARQPDELDRTTVSERTPLARNSILVAGVFTLSLAVVTVVPALLLYLRARKTTIIVQQARVRRDRGILFRTTQTVLNNRIDQLLTNRGPVHTLFGNGVVSVLTVGSSTPALSLGPIVDERTLYDEIDARIPEREGE